MKYKWVSNIFFSQQQKKSNQKNAVYRDGRACPAHKPELPLNSPRRFFILLNKSLFNAPVRTAHPCAEPNLEESKGHAELSPLINLNWRSIRSMFQLAKEID
ncbi:MAG: hypothetical protein ACI8UC_001154 [Psychromonas sp.]|jgi:hypothetical protein